MIRSRVVSGFLTIVALSLVYVPAATANPVIDEAYRLVHGTLTTPTGGSTPAQDVYTYDTSASPFVAHVGDAVIESDASAEFTADQNSTITEFLIEATGSTSGTVTNSTADVTSTDAISYGYVNFTLDGNYTYDYSGLLTQSVGSSTGNGYAYTYLLDVTHGAFLDQAGNNSALLVPFSFSGTIGQGSYQLLFESFSFPQTYGGLQESSNFFDVTFSLTPAVPTVPDGGNTVILLLFGSAFLGALALRERRQA
jgi:hypothetical protein